MQKKQVMINNNVYKKMHYCQPYYVFSRGEKEIPYIDINGFKLYDEKNHESDSKNEKWKFMINEILSDNEEQEDNLENYKMFFEEQLKKAEYISWNYEKENQNMFLIAQKQLQEYAIKNIIQNNSYEILNVAKKVDEAIYETINSINSNNRFIFYPTFAEKIDTQNNIDFYFKSTPFLYDKINKTLYLSKFVSKTNILDYLDAKFHYECATRFLNKNFINAKKDKKIKNIKIILINKTWMKTKKIEWIETTAARSSKSQASKNLNNLHLTENEKENIKEQLNKLNNGLAYNNKNLYQRDLNFMYSIENNCVLGGLILKIDKNNNSTEIKLKKDLPLNESCSFINFDLAIKNAINYYFIKKPNFSIEKDYGFEFYLDKDNTNFGKNSLINEILLKYLGYEFVYSPGLVSKKNVIDEEYVQIFKEEVSKLKSIPNFFTNNTIFMLSEYNKRDERIIWYDYEGLTSLIPLFDGNEPYLQVTNQVSLLETINGEITNKIDIVKDPKNIKLIDIVDNIITVYSNKADKYIVYNKSYENSKNKDIVNYVKKYYQKNNIDFILEMKKRNINSVNEFAKIVEHINKNTLDLLDFLKRNVVNEEFQKDKYNETPYKGIACFQSNLVPVFNFRENEISNELEIAFQKDKDELKKISTKYFYENNKTKNIFIYELLGKSSIKKIENLITTHNIKLKNNIIPYKELNVKNGGMALQVAMNRFLGYTGDNEWKEKEKHLKKYCANDVKAMLMTYDFIMKFVADKFPEIYNYEHKLEQNQYLAYNFDTKKIEIIEK
ncbi:UU173 family protein [Mycoplasmopsis lipofaciens]|uniref:UU173 family protein n=1 Tax=Mycoplasmopsis lipofaciens TaxID=114884 RepID=UPI0004844D29|nr:DUF2779 domain-containing protein [Mycoplasmopsis lipofaciens]